MRILLHGATGRLGREIADAAAALQVACGPLERDKVGHPAEMAQLLQEPVVVCDVTRPEGTVTLATAIRALAEPQRRNVVGLVVGTTGHSELHLENLRSLTEDMAICLVPNFSRGVYLFEQILRARTPAGVSVAELARQLGFELGGWEIHHRHKVDAPSGTAKQLAVTAGMPANAFASARIGSVVGEHTLAFSGDAEEVRITHIAHTRRLFALGAIDICRRMFAARPVPGLYTRDDFLQAN